MRGVWIVVLIIGIYSINADHSFAQTGNETESFSEPETSIEEKIFDEGTEITRSVVDKGIEISKPIIEEEKERRQEIDQQRQELKEKVDQKGSEIIQEIEKNAGGGCLIATAAYGSELAPQIQQLRELRDKILLKTESGSIFMEGFNDFYYSFSPIIADYERENPVFKEVVKAAITPMISSLSILNHVDIDTEVEVLGYGSSIIFLNIGMYVGVPITFVLGLKKSAKRYQDRMKI